MSSLPLSCAGGPGGLRILPVLFLCWGLLPVSCAAGRGSVTQPGTSGVFIGTQVANGGYRCSWTGPSPWTFGLSPMVAFVRSASGTVIATWLGSGASTRLSCNTFDPVGHWLPGSGGCSSPSVPRAGSVPYRAVYDPVLEDYWHIAVDMEDLPANRNPGFRRAAWLVNYVQAIHFFMVGFLALLPNDITNWDDEDKNIRGAVRRWKENVRNGPVTDSDAGYLNWVVHPWMGSGYYCMGRRSGLKPFESFLFSAFASTCLWEYGIEAIAEEPSRQDLVITPVVGSLIGEFAMREDARVKRNGGRVLGSRMLGDMWRWILNPFWRMTTSLAHSFNGKVHADFSTEIFRDVNVFPIEYSEDSAFQERIMEWERIYGVRVKLRF